MKVKQQQMLIIALASNKGGVGKTITTVGMAHKAREQGKRVLVVDNDGQGNATTAFLQATNGDAFQATLADVYDKDVPTTANDAIYSTAYEGIDVIPSGFDQFDPVIQNLASNNLSPNQVLQRALEPVRKSYDLILIDCPPALGYATLNALVAADRVLTLCDPSTFAHNGLAKLVDIVDQINAEIRSSNPLPDPTVLINDVNFSATRGDGDAVAAIRKWSEKNDVHVHPAEVPRKTLIKTLSESGRSLGASNDATAQYVFRLYGDLFDAIRKEN